MKVLLGLIVVSLYVSRLAESACFPFCLLQGKSASTRLNKLLLDSTDSDELSRNIEATRAVLGNVKDHKTLKLANTFLALEKITEENVCQDESLETVDSLTHTMRQDSPDAFEVPKLNQRLNTLVGQVAKWQLKTCAPKFISMWRRSDAELAQFEVLKYLPEGLRRGSTEGSLLKNQNRWLLKQRDIDLRGDNSQRALAYALKEAARRAGLDSLRKEEKTGKLTNDLDYITELLYQKLISPCQQFEKLGSARLLKKLLAVLRSGNIKDEDLDKFYYDEPSAEHRPVEWAMRWSCCELLLRNDYSRLANLLFVMVMFGHAA